MSVYTTYKCDRCGSSNHGGTGTAWYRIKHSPLAGKCEQPCQAQVDLCGACFALMIGAAVMAAPLSAAKRFQARIDADARPAQEMIYEPENGGWREVHR